MNWLWTWTSIVLVCRTRGKNWENEWRVRRAKMMINPNSHPVPSSRGSAHIIHINIRFMTSCFYSFIFYCTTKPPAFHFFPSLLRSNARQTSSKILFKIDIGGYGYWNFYAHIRSSSARSTANLRKWSCFLVFNSRRILTIAVPCLQNKHP